MATQHTTVVPISGTVHVIQHGGSTTQCARQNIRNFSTGLCGCFEDCNGCLFGFFCMACYLCSLAWRLDESCCVPLCVQGGVMALRTKLRVMYGIKGSICNDCMYVACCPPLAACQLDREMKNCGL